MLAAIILSVCLQKEIEGYREIGSIIFAHQEMENVSTAEHYHFYKTYPAKEYNNCIYKIEKIYYDSRGGKPTQNSEWSEVRKLSYEDGNRIFGCLDADRKDSVAAKKFQQIPYREYNYKNSKHTIGLHVNLEFPENQTPIRKSVFIHLADDIDIRYALYGSRKKEITPNDKADNQILNIATEIIDVVNSYEHKPRLE